MSGQDAVMRLPAVAAALLALALPLVGCGGEDETQTTVSQSTALPLTVQRAGGVAGIRDTLVVRKDGSGSVTHGDGTRRRLEADETTGVRSALRELQFAGLDERYGPPEGTQVADGIDYSFTAGGRTVVVLEMAEDVPAPLMRLQAAAGQAMGA